MHSHYGNKFFNLLPSKLATFHGLPSYPSSFLDNRLMSLLIPYDGGMRHLIYLNLLGLPSFSAATSFVGLQMARREERKQGFAR